MISRRTLFFLTALLLALLCGSRASGAPQRLEDGAVSRAGTWSTQGGSPARTGVSLSAPVEGEPVEAWRRGPARFEGEPVVWGRRVVTAIKSSESRRTIRAFDLETGKLLFQHRLKATVPLELSLWEDLLAARVSEERAELFRIRGSRLLPVRTFQDRGGVSAPLLFEDEIYVRMGNDLVAYAPRTREPRWIVRVEGGFRGTPSLRGPNVYAGWYDGAGNLRIGVHARRDGRSLVETRAGHHGRRSIPHSARLTLSVHADDVFCEYPFPAESTDGRSFTWGRVARAGGGSAALHPYGVMPVPFGPGWIVREELDRGRSRWITARKETEGLSARILSDARNQPWLTAFEQPTSIAGDVAYLGGSAVSLVDDSLRWRRESRLTERPVPANGVVLWVEGKTLRAMRSGSPPPTATEQRASELVAGIEGRLALDLSGLADKALRAGDLGRSERLLHEALELGATEPLLERTRQRLDGLSGASRPPALDRGKLRVLEREEARLRSRPQGELLELARGTADTPLARELMRRLFERDPRHTEAASTVLGWVPDDFPRTRGALDPLSWLDFLDVYERKSVRYLAPPHSKRDRTAGEEALLRERGRWRRDVGGYLSERLLVITPPGRPGAVARSLELGELVCDLLEELFGSGGSQANAAPLTMLLYETREEYIRQSRRERSGPEIGLGWTAGHYSSAENLSRMYVPEDDGTYGELLGIYAHELTHHWLEVRSPMSRDVGRPLRTLEQPGYWVGEGFATLIEEFLLDPRRGTWDSENPRSPSLDTLASATPDQLLPWDLVLGASYTEFTQLGTEPDRTIPLTWRLGVRSRRSPIQMFYAQAGAVSQYLFNAEGGRHRRSLVQYVGAWYRGDEERLDPRRAFGLSAGELGRQAHAYAHETLARATGR